MRAEFLTRTGSCGDNDQRVLWLGVIAAEPFSIGVVYELKGQAAIFVHIGETIELNPSPNGSS